MAQLSEDWATILKTVRVISDVIIVIVGSARRPEVGGLAVKGYVVVFLSITDLNNHLAFRCVA